MITATAKNNLLASYCSMTNPQRLHRFRLNLKTSFAAQYQLAAELEAMSAGALAVNFDEEATYSSEKRVRLAGRSVNPSAGHIFKVHLCDDCDFESPTGSYMSVDDRRGDVRQQLAGELRRVAGIYLRLAETYEANGEREQCHRRAMVGKATGRYRVA